MISVPASSPCYHWTHLNFQDGLNVHFTGCNFLPFLLSSGGWFSHFSLLAPSPDCHNQPPVHRNNAISHIVTSVHTNLSRVWVWILEVTLTYNGLPVSLQEGLVWFSSTPFLRTACYSRQGNMVPIKHTQKYFCRP